MHTPAFNPAMIRVVVFVLFVIISQFLRARKKLQPPRPSEGGGTVKASPLDAMRDAMRQAAEQARARRGEGLIDTEPQLTPQPQPGQELQQPSTIEPESSLIPSFLLVALFACLCFMAYRYWAP